MKYTRHGPNGNYVDAVSLINNTPAIPAGGQASVVFLLPRKTGKDPVVNGVKFTINVNKGGKVQEGNVKNDTADGSCPS